MVDKLEAIRIVTRCTSREQFIGMFSRYCTPTSCFIPSTDSRDIGTATAFSVRLADASVLLKGEGVVLDAWTHGDHKFKRAGILLGIHRLDEACAELFEQLLQPRSMAVPIPPKTQLQMLLVPPPSPTSEIETPTIEMPPLALPDEPRVPPSPFVLPANPMAEMTDDSVAEFVECNLVAEDVMPPILPAHHPIPVEVFYEPTERTPMARGSRDVIATILGVAPLQKHVFAAPELVMTEGMDRVETPRFSLIMPRPLTSPEPLLSVGLASLDAVAITYGDPVPRSIPRPRATPTAFLAERPRQRLRISAIGIIPITQVVRGPARRLNRLRRRLARKLMPSLRRYWIPATVATSLVLVAALWIV